MENELIICKRCIYDSNVPGIEFDLAGVCNYCRQIEDLERQYLTGTPKGIELLSCIIHKIKCSGKNNKYDCIIGVSGGTDSSYLLLKSLEWGLRPLAVHYDNTWNSDIAIENIQKVTKKLKIDIYSYAIEKKEADDIFRAFLLAGVPEFDASSDMAIAQVLRLAAAKYNVKYILDGHSFKTEGISPQKNNYFDGKYIQNIHRIYGKYSMKTYPLMTFYQFMKWVLIYRQIIVRPFWYINYSKSVAREQLIKKTGWAYYGGHHLENKATAYLHKVYNPKKFGIDNRNWNLAAEVRSGNIERDKALEIYNTTIKPDLELEKYVKIRLELSDNEYEEIMKGPKRTYLDFKTYKKRFEQLRPFFKILAKNNLVPMSFYLKYCFPLPEGKLK